MKTTSRLLILACTLAFPVGFEGAENDRYCLKRKSVTIFYDFYMTRYYRNLFPDHQLRFLIKSLLRIPCIQIRIYHFMENQLVSLTEENYNEVLDTFDVRRLDSIIDQTEFLEVDHNFQKGENFDEQILLYIS